MVLYDMYSDPDAPFYIWDLSADQLRAIGSFWDIQLWHMNVDENVLVISEVNWYTRPLQPQLEVHQTKWTLTGEPLGSKRFHLPLPLPVDRVKDIGYLPGLYSNHRTFGHKTITRLYAQIGKRKHTILDLMYDYSIDKLTLQRIDYSLTLKTLDADLCEVLSPYITYQ